MDRALHTTVEALTALPDVHLAVACAPLYRGRLPRHERVTPVDHYPMAELYPAFDGAVSAAGYNTAMELLHHGVPTVFVPFARQVDDQEARAHRIVSAGAGLTLPALEPAALQSAVLRLLLPDEAAGLREAAREMVPDSGADRAVQALLSLLPQ